MTSGGWSMRDSFCKSHEESSIAGDPWHVVRRLAVTGQVLLSLPISIGTVNPLPKGCQLTSSSWQQRIIVNRDRTRHTQISHDSTRALSMAEALGMTELPSSSRLPTPPPVPPHSTQQTHTTVTLAVINVTTTLANDFVLRSTTQGETRHAVSSTALRQSSRSLSPSHLNLSLSSLLLHHHHMRGRRLS